ncbi:hypothetical protein JNUCC1_00639 [Lentibacillus sp. JNUCC-1]|uniref:OsmC family protein n=1 Tax=Lentibacillus sp. JNUCC-1 TaxID=2654513 RepID=UPI0012E886E0|nr:OsmC family protein [Lentibacillus sp. JNUCC-1]MUV36835.1 hypothetical protein [Lentibacillus sp. JNUCC-1]
MKKEAVLSVSGHLESNLKNTVKVRNLDPFTVDEPERLGGGNSGPNPLEYFLGSLSACTSIMVAKVAKEQGFTYQGLEFSADGSLDPRGYLGVADVQTYFQKVDLTIILDTSENQDAIDQLQYVVEKRCPLFNLLKDAGVEINSSWTVKV